MLGRVKIAATGKPAIGVVALPATGIAPDRRAAGVGKIEATGMAFAVEESMRDGYPVELRVDIARFEQLWGAKWPSAGFVVDNRGLGPLLRPGLVGGRVVRFLLSVIAAAFKPRMRLIAENLCLWQQLLVRLRRRPQPRLSNADRWFWTSISRWFGGWRGSLLIVEPETVLRLIGLDLKSHR